MKQHANEALYFDSERELRNFFSGIGIKLTRWKRGAYSADSKLTESWGVMFLAFRHTKESGKKYIAFIYKFKRGGRI